MRRPLPSTVYQGMVWAKNQRVPLPTGPMESRPQMAGATRMSPFAWIGSVSVAAATPLSLLIMETEPKGKWAGAFARLSMISSVGNVVGLLLSTIWTLNDFNIVYIMTRGGPGAATHIFATYSYELGIQSQRWGLAMAASMYSLPLIALLIVFVVRYLHREEPAS